MNPARVSAWIFTIVLALFLGTAGASLGFGQATGSILGSVEDPSGARVAGVTVTVSNASTGVQRTVQTNESGLYVVSALLPADYDVTVEMTGFTKLAKHVTLSAGSDLTVDFALAVGSTSQTVNVESQALEVNLVNSKVDADINPTDIAQFPLIGRNAYELAKMSPAVVISTAPGRNNDIAISIIGKATTSTHVTLNGLDISNATSGGEPEMNFSQELVQEFQVSINNGDPNNGASSSGTINLVTNRGENLLHGAAYGYFRNSQYASYPGISHPAVIPNPENLASISQVNATDAAPDFYRRVFGGLISGPIRKDHAYWLVSAEDTQQESATDYNPNYTAFNNAFNIVGLVPEQRFTGSVRFDWQVNPNNSLFFMGAMDRLDEWFTAAGGPSEDAIRKNNAFVGMLGWTRVFSTNFVGDFRFGMDYYTMITLPTPDAYNLAATYAAGSGLATIGSFSVVGTNMAFGGRTDSPQQLWAPRPQFTSSFTYTHGANTWKFGYIVEPTEFRWTANNDVPMTGTVYNPTQAAAAGISVPATYNTYADLLQLPLQSFSFGIGNQITFPDSYDRNKLLWTWNYNFYVGSSYKATQNLTVNWDLLYSFNGGAPNRDLPLPASMAIFTGGDLNPPQNRKDDLSPSFGFSWDPFGHGKTVIRGGTGYYYGLVAPAQAVRGRGNILPVGDGQAVVAGTAIPNPKTGVGFLNFPTANSNAAAGVFRLQDLVNDIAGIEANLLSTVFTGTNNNMAVRNFDYFKGDTTGIYDPNFRLPTSWQNMFGVQQQLGADWLVEASYIFNVSNHEQLSYDANLSTRPAAYGGPIVPSLGQVILYDTGGRSIYRGLLVDVKKSFSHHYVLTAAYTNQVAQGTVFDNFTPTALINYTNRADNWGPFASIPTNIFSLGATAMNLPWGLELSLVNYMQSDLPFNPYLAGLDMTGDGTTNDHLPEVAYDSVNRGCNKNCLIAAVANFNATYAGHKDTEGTLINPITLPANFRTGDHLWTQDLRLTKKIHIHERVNLNLEAEVYNLLNWANLDYATSAGNLYSTGFGQPTDRNGTYFGTGGPRSMQFAARMSF